MFDPFTLFAISATFVIAGGVKGVIGLGLPSVSLGLLTATLDLPTAMALMIAPSFFTNSYQATVGGLTFFSKANAKTISDEECEEVWFKGDILHEYDLFSS